jgi:hypothetical protein
MSKKWLTIVIMVLAFSVEAYAEPITLNFHGGQLSVVGEFINAQPVALQEFAPSFQSGQTINISISYETNQPDTNPNDPTTGTYKIGSLSVNIPEIGLSAIRSSSSMQISSFNDTANPDDQFFAYVSGVDSYSNSAGLPSPTAFSVLLFGDTSMLANDQLPVSPLNWTFGNAIFDFTDSAGVERQVLLSFLPAFSPPATSIYPTSANHANCGNTGSKILVLPGGGGSWTATSNDLWMNVTAGDTGTGFGYVTYSVEANSGPDRIGTMTIAGQTFTVYQKSAIPCISAPVLVSPPNGATSVPANITLTWNPPTGAEGYEVWVTTDPAFNSHVIQAGTYDVFFDVPPNVLMPGILYYWGVIAHNGTYGTQSNWSSLWSFTAIPSVTLTSENVSIPAHVSMSSSGPPPPSGFQLGNPPTYYDIGTTVNYTQPVTACIPYDPAQYTDPSSLRLLHYESATWLDVTTSNNVATHIICGQVTSLSPFLIAQKIDKPPVITSVSANPTVLWPANNKMVDVTVNYSATDDGGQPVCKISSVTSNEQLSGSDYSIADAHHIKLRATRLGGGNGRIYTITIRCTDTSGKSSDKTVNVSVPHDQGKK